MRNGRKKSSEKTPGVYNLLALPTFRHTERNHGTMDKEPAVAEAVVRACALLKAFRHEGELLALRDLVGRTGLSKTTAHRLAQSLVRGGLLERAGRNEYRSLVRPLGGPGFRLGFAAQTTDSEFSRERSEEHTSELQSHVNLVCRLLLEKKKKKKKISTILFKLEINRNKKTNSVIRHT